MGDKTEKMGGNRILPINYANYNYMFLLNFINSTDKKARGLVTAGFHDEVNILIIFIGKLHSTVEVKTQSTVVRELTC